MARKQLVTMEDDAPTMTDAELAEFRPAREVLSEEQFEAVSSVRRGRPKVAEPKVPVTIRLDRFVVDAFKATGKGWQSRINETLVRSAVSGRYATVKTSATAREAVTIAPSGKTVLRDSASGKIVAPRKAKQTRQSRA